MRSLRLHDGRKNVRTAPRHDKGASNRTSGATDGLRRTENQEVLSWNNRLASGWAWDRADYNVIVTDGQVSEYGQGEVRPKANGTLVIIPLRPL